jgi:hypothetical protein
MGFGTVAEIINDAAVEVGLGGSVSAPYADPFVSTDPNIKQLIIMLKSAGRELVKERNWNYLRRECTITTVQGVSNYALPADFLNMIDQTGWVRSTRLPMMGPVSPQEWQYLKARLVGVTLTILFRPLNRTIQIFPDGTNAPGGLVLAFEYQSAFWVGGDPTVTGGVSTDAVLTFATGDEPTSATSIVWFDKWMFSRLLKLRFLEDKGLPTAAAERAYKTALDMAASDDMQGPILNLSRKPSSWLMGERNVPYTGFGGP